MLTEQMREWFDEHLKLMNEMMSQLMDEASNDDAEHGNAGHGQEVIGITAA